MLEDSRVGVSAGEIVDECIEGVRVVAVLSCRLDCVRPFFGRSVGICTASVSGEKKERSGELTIHEFAEVCSLECRG
jgi:hypothetical protein